MSKEPKEEWGIALEMNHAERTYTVKHIDRPISFDYRPLFLIEIMAEDEIGAFKAATKILSNLGFHPKHS